MVHVNVVSIREEAKEARDTHLRVFSTWKSISTTRLTSQHKAKLPLAARNYLLMCSDETNEALPTKASTYVTALHFLKNQPEIKKK